MNATAADIFARFPAATLVFVELGHAYGKAKFNSRCKLTGDEIHAYEPIRKVVAVTRGGHTFEGYIANRTLAALATREGAPGVFFTTYTKCTDGWAAALTDMPLDTRIEVIDVACREAKRYHYSHVWDRWVTPTGSRVTTKQLVASLNKSTRNLLWRVAP